MAHEISGYVHAHVKAHPVLEGKKKFKHNFEFVMIYSIITTVTINHDNYNYAITLSEL